MYERTLSSVTTIPHHSPALRRHGDGESTGPSSARDVVLDWSDIEPGTKGTQHSVEDLINWISNCPRPSGIRVYLPPVRQRVALQKLRHSLLALGVTVTCRMRYA